MNSRPGNKTTATVHGKGANGEVFNGKYQITSFRQGGPTGVEAVGNLTGQLSNTGQGGVQQVTQNALALPVNLDQTTASCQILDLVLGRLPALHGLATYFTRKGRVI